MANFNLEEWRRNTPTLNQSGTFRGDFEDFDYDVPFGDDIAYDNPLGEAIGGNRFGGGSVGEGGFQPGEARQGRYGDNMMRMVQGEESHVNPQEARLIDKYGKLGEGMVQMEGSGTTNPGTGRREYFGGMALAGGALQMGAGLYGAHQMNQASNKAIAGQQAGLQGAQEYGALGKSFLDPQSEQNQMYLQNIQQQGMDQVALQNQMGQRNAAAYGGGFSGATAMQGKQAGLQAGLQGRQQWLGMMGQQQQTGLGMMNAANQQQQKIRDSIAELQMGQAAGQTQMLTAGASGLSGGLLDYAQMNPKYLTEMGKIK